MFSIYDNGGVVDMDILLRWNCTNKKSLNTYEEAHECVERWLGSSQLAVKNKNILNNPVDYSGMGHTIEIKYNN